MTSIVRLLLAACLAGGCAGVLAAPAATPPAPALDAAAAPIPAQTTARSAPLVVDGRPIFRMAGIPSFPAAARAEMAAERIRALARDPAFKPETLQLREEAIGTAILGGSQVIFVVHELDAQLEGVERSVVAQVFRQRIADAIQAYRDERTPESVWRSLLAMLVAAALLAAYLWVTRWFVLRVTTRMEPRYQAKLKGLQAKSFGVLDADQMWTLLARAFWTAWGLAALAVGFLVLHFALNVLPWTRRGALWLEEVGVEPLRVMGAAVRDSIPDLIFLVLLALIVRYLLKALELYFVGLESGAIRHAGFYPEWASTTYKLVRFGIVAFALVIAYPYIPGSSSDAFKGVSVFLGVVVSLGGSTIIANTLAGYTLIYRRAFQIGDRVKIGDKLGDIVEMRAQVTTLRTPKNEHVVLPNSMLLTNEIVNYSVLARQGRLILHSTVTIGYDAPWRQVEALLLEAAARTQGLLKEPAPFVLQNALGDFYVDYEINAYCGDASQMAGLYSALHRNIQDQFNEHGVQIMSPHFEAQPEKAVVVPKPQWYAAPARPPEDAPKA